MLLRTSTENGSCLFVSPARGLCLFLPSVHLPSPWSLTVFRGVPSSTTPDGAQQQIGRWGFLAGSMVLIKRYVHGTLGSRRMTAEVTAEADRVLVEDCSRPSRRPTWSGIHCCSSATYLGRWVGRQVVAPTVGIRASRCWGE